MEKKYILFVVSDPVDIILTQMVFRDSSVPNELSIVSSKEQALRFLRREAPYQNEQRPDLIVVDLNASSISDLSFFQEIKSSRELRRIPLVVFTLHMIEEEITRLYDLNVNCCVRKPVDLEEFTRVIESIEKFWLTAVKFQRRSSIPHF